MAVTEIAPGLELEKLSGYAEYQIEYANSGTEEVAFAAGDVVDEGGALAAPDSTKKLFVVVRDAVAPAGGSAVVTVCRGVRATLGSLRFDAAPKDMRAGDIGNLASNGIVLDGVTGAIFYTAA